METMPDFVKIMIVGLVLFLIIVYLLNDPDD